MRCEVTVFMCWSATETRKYPNLWNESIEASCSRKQDYLTHISSSSCSKKTTHVSFVSAVKQTGTNLYRSPCWGVQLRVSSAFPFSSSLNTLVMLSGPLTWKSWMLQEETRNNYSLKDVSLAESVAQLNSLISDYLECWAWASAFSRKFWPTVA